MFEDIENTFLYFAYGSNLLKRRIRINNPSATFLGIGRLDDHQLDFIKYSEHWRGTSATIVPTPGAQVWGAIWRLNNDDMPALDKQEGVDTNWYFAKAVKIVLPNGSSTDCRTYQQTINPPIRKKGEELPPERRPCITYLNCIVTGAMECKIPEDYIEELKKIPNNGQEASPKMIEKLQKSTYVKLSVITKKMMKSKLHKPDTFLYFAYAANMFKFRLRTFCPTAEFASIARLDNFRLDFMKLSQFWEGPLATIVPTANAHVWGVIWRLHKDDLEFLDNQRDVDTKKFFVKNVQVLTPHMDIITCRTYMQKVYPLPKGNRDPIPVEQWPSWSYKQIIIMGAKENGLPPCYIRFLRKLKDNGNEGYIRADCLIRRYGYDVPCDCRLPTVILREPLKLYLKKIRSNKQVLI